MIKAINSALGQVIQCWDEFWFRERSLLNLGIMRVVIAGTLFLMYLSRQRDALLYFTESGILPKAQALVSVPEFYRSPIYLASWSDQAVPYVHGFLVLGLFLLFLGIGGRILNLAMFVLHLAFLQRNYSIAFGADLCGGIFLMLLSGTRCCEAFNIYDWVRWVKAKSINLDYKKKSSENDMFTSVFYRLIQIQLCTIYFFTGLEKLKGAPWWDGTALWTVLANPQMVIFDLIWLRNFWVVLVLGTYVTMIFEVYFLPMILVKKTRPWVMLAGFCFHMGIGLFMSLWSFAFIMVASYVLWINEGYWQFITAKIFRGSQKV